MQPIFLKFEWNLKAEPYGHTVNRYIIILSFILLLMPVDARPEGIGMPGDSGCVCHGNSDSYILINVSGIPQEYIPSQVYNFSISANGGTKDSVGNASGGFRVLVDGGQMVIDGSQELEDGYTHTLDSNQQRIWNGTWTAPSADDEGINLIVHINLVDGDEMTSNDEWNSASFLIAGPEYTGDTTPADVSGAITSTEMAIGLFAILLLIGFAWMSIRE